MQHSKIVGYTTQSFSQRKLRKSATKKLSLETSFQCGGLSKTKSLRAIFNLCRLKTLTITTPPFHYFVAAVSYSLGPFGSCLKDLYNHFKLKCYEIRQCKTSRSIKC